MDAADFANEYLESAMDRATQERERRRQEAIRQAQASGGCCVQCSERIPPARLAAVDTDLCIECAELTERRGG